MFVTTSVRKNIAGVATCHVVRGVLLRSFSIKETEPVTSQGNARDNATELGRSRIKKQSWPKIVTADVRWLAPFKRISD